MKRLLLIFSVLLILVGCRGSGYELDDPISPKLEGLQDPEDFYDQGFEMVDQRSFDAADNVADQL
ncbi:MAG: hypothetical protein ABII07_04860 [Patescibacteria group bacterium]|nr:hypothetical protein [Patescibacteria group bacterium]